jgi:hypothetical protein
MHRKFLSKQNLGAYYSRFWWCFRPGNDFLELGLFTMVVRAVVVLACALCVLIALRMKWFGIRVVLDAQSLWML